MFKLQQHLPQVAISATSSMAVIRESYIKKSEQHLTTGSRADIAWEVKHLCCLEGTRSSWCLDSPGISYQSVIISTWFTTGHGSPVASFQLAAHLDKHEPLSADNNYHPERRERELKTIGRISPLPPEFPHCAQPEEKDLGEKWVTAQEAGPLQRPIHSAMICISSKSRDND
uniref:Uncharacterized protein n=1 Tax=Mus musculus TaxID=10090 RepID=Q8CC72_MOUSE|nr:unnamed protein product [Mus musculus]